MSVCYTTARARYRTRSYLALLLRTGDHASGSTAVDIARQLLNRYGDNLEAVSGGLCERAVRVAGHWHG